jgi:hypothetical protein
VPGVALPLMALARFASETSTVAPMRMSNAATSAPTILYATPLMVTVSPALKLAVVVRTPVALTPFVCLTPRKAKRVSI